MKFTVAALASLVVVLCGCGGASRIDAVKPDPTFSLSSTPTCQSFDGRHLANDDALSSCMEHGTVQLLVWIDDACTHYTTVGWYRDGEPFHYVANFAKSPDDLQVLPTC